jgi:hypothetical protein
MVARTGEPAVSQANMARLQRLDDCRGAVSYFNVKESSTVTITDVESSWPTRLGWIGPEPHPSFIEVFC